MLRILQTRVCWSIYGLRPRVYELRFLFKAPKFSSTFLEFPKFGFICCPKFIIDHQRWHLDHFQRFFCHDLRERNQNTIHMNLNNEQEWSLVLIYVSCLVCQKEWSGLFMGETIMTYVVNTAIFFSVRIAFQYQIIFNIFQPYSTANCIMLFLLYPTGTCWCNPWSRASGIGGRITTCVDSATRLAWVYPHTQLISATRKILWMNLLDNIMIYKFKYA